MMRHCSYSSVDRRIPHCLNEVSMSRIDQWDETTHYVTCRLRSDTPHLSNTHVNDAYYTREKLIVTIIGKNIGIHLHRLSIRSSRSSSVINFPDKQKHLTYFNLLYIDNLGTKLCRSAFYFLSACTI
jgi:hypothetical protein